MLKQFCPKTINNKALIGTKTEKNNDFGGLWRHQEAKQGLSQFFEMFIFD